MLDRMKRRFGFVTGFFILWAVLHATSMLRADTLAGVIVFGATLGAALLVEHYFFGTSPRRAILDLGLGRPAMRSLVAAGAVSLVIAVAYGLYVGLADTGVSLRSYWPLHLAGLFLFNGLAEELVWRGYMYRRLRATRSFRGAVLASMPLMALTHVYIAVDNGLVVAIGALVVAAITCLPFAYLFDRGAKTIWAAAMLHAAIDLFRIFEIPEDDRAMFSAVIAIAAMVLPLSVFFFRDSFFASVESDGRAQTRGAVVSSAG